MQNKCLDGISVLKSRRGGCLVMMPPTSKVSFGPHARRVLRIAGGVVSHNSPWNEVVDLNVSQDAHPAFRGNRTSGGMRKQEPSVDYGASNLPIVSETRGRTRLSCYMPSLQTDGLVFQVTACKNAAVPRGRECKTRRQHVLHHAIPAKCSTSAHGPERRVRLRSRRIKCAWCTIDVSPCG